MVSGSKFAHLVFTMFRVLTIFELFVSGNGQDGIRALMAFKASADPGGVLDRSWNPSQNKDVCTWMGVKQCVDGSITKLVLKNVGLSGTFSDKTLNTLSELRVLNLEGNRLRGTVPEFSAINNLKTLNLGQNNFKGPIPESIANLSRLNVLIIKRNDFSGQIPAGIAGIVKLTTFCVQENRLEGSIPVLNQTTLKCFNVSNNRLSGPIPATVALSVFKSDVFAGNPGLCGGSLDKPCKENNLYLGTVNSVAVVNKLSGKQICGISIWITLGITAIVFLMSFYTRRSNGQIRHGIIVHEKKIDEECSSVSISHPVLPCDHVDSACMSMRRSVDLRSEPEDGAVLTFCDMEIQDYSLEDLLKASAEVLGRGTVGTTYRAVMESGMVVIVKRLKNPKALSRTEFYRHMEAIGKVRHPNIVPLRAYFQANEERLLVYDYKPSRSLFSLIHGQKSKGGRLLHWNSCLKIAEAVATGLAHLHHNCKLIHANLKPSNILIAKNFEVYITDVGIANLEADDESGPENKDSRADPAFMVYKAPECKAAKMSIKSDVYSFGLLVLEVLTGQIPLPALTNGRLDDMGEWVHSLRKQQIRESGLDDSIFRDKLELLVNMAMGCVCPCPDDRPSMRVLLRMIEDAKGDQTPRWADNKLNIAVESVGESSSKRLERH